jgi:hypothetical protein
LKPSGCIFNDSEVAAFANVETTRPERDITKVKCYKCNNKDLDKEKGITEAITATMTIDEDNANDYDNWEEFSFHQSNRKVSMDLI